MGRKKVQKKKGRSTVLVNTETGEKLYVPLDDTMDLSETGISLFFERVYNFFKWESYLLFFKQEGVPNIMLKALPDQIKEMLVPQLTTHPDLLKCFMEATTDALAILEERGTKETHLT